MAGYTGAAGTNDGNWKGGGNTGLTTGNTIYGNTAYGPAGGMAQGYATRDMASLNKAGQGPMMGTFSNFMGLGGQPAYGGALGGMGFNAMNANEAAGMASNYYNQNRQMGPAVTYGAEPVKVDPLRPMFHPNQPVPTSLTVPRQPLDKSMMPAFFGGGSRPSAGGMPVGYDPMRAAIAPDFRRNMTRQAGNYSNPALGAAARGTLGNYAGASLGPGMGSSFGPGMGNSLGPGTGNRWGY